MSASSFCCGAKRLSHSFLRSENLSAISIGNKSIEIFLNVVRNDEMAKCLSETKTCWNVLMLWVYHSTGLIRIPDKNFSNLTVLSAVSCLRFRFVLSTAARFLPADTHIRVLSTYIPQMYDREALLLSVHFLMYL